MHCLRRLRQLSGAGGYLALEYLLTLVLRERCMKWVMTSLTSQVRIERQNSQPEQLSPDCLLVGLLEEREHGAAGWPGPGPTRWHVEREAAEREGGVHFATNDFENEANAMLESPSLRTFSFKLF